MITFCCRSLLGPLESGFCCCLFEPSSHERTAQHRDRGHLSAAFFIAAAWVWSLLLWLLKSCPRCLEP